MLVFVFEGRGLCCSVVAAVFVVVDGDAADYYSSVWESLE